MVVRTLLAACAAFSFASPVLAGVGEPQADSMPQAISSPIVYQGELSYLNIPVTASADLRFRAFSAAQAGEQIGREINLEGVELTNGSFEVVLDFGLLTPSVWIEVDVRSPAGAGEFTTLSPRQRYAQALIVTPADTAPQSGEGQEATESNVNRQGGLISGRTAPRPGTDPIVTGGVSQTNNLGSDVTGAGSGSRGGGWLANGNDVYFNTGNVGIGLVAPTAPLHVRDRGARVLWVVNNRSGASSGFGIQAEANGNSSRAIFARANSTSGYNYGVFGQSLSSRGTGVFGQTASTFGTGIGVSGVSRAASGTGVRGLTTNLTGTSFGVLGEVMSSNAWAGYFMGGKGLYSENGLTVGEDLSSPLGGIRSEGSIFIDTGNLSFLDEASEAEIRSNSELVFHKDANNNDDFVNFEWRSNNGADLQMYLTDGPAGDGADAALFVDGDVNANGFDYAELFTTGQDGLEAGDVVVMARGHADSILLATDAYQELLVGVVSTDPAFIAGNQVPDDLANISQAGESAQGSRAEIRDQFYRRQAEHLARTRPIALAGRVPVKVDASFGAIKAGDRLTSSSTPGHAMVQTEAGPTIGIALEDFSQGQGKVTVLVQPGWYGGSAASNAIDAKDTRILELEARLEALEALLMGGNP